MNSMTTYQMTKSKSHIQSKHLFSLSIFRLLSRAALLQVPGNERDPTEGLWVGWVCSIQCVSHPPWARNIIKTILSCPWWIKWSPISQAHAKPTKDWSLPHSTGREGRLGKVLSGYRDIEKWSTSEQYSFHIREGTVLESTPFIKETLLSGNRQRRTLWELLISLFWISTMDTHTFCK